jgi:hypothetical protein
VDQEWIEKLLIQELCARYCHTMDNQDPESWAQCFTPDGIFESARPLARLNGG